jgi:hypothetical protein
MHMTTFVEDGQTITVRTFQMRKPDGAMFWQARFDLQVPSGARWHGVTAGLHETEQAAEDDARALVRANKWGPRTSVPMEAQATRALGSESGID